MNENREKQVNFIKELISKNDSWWKDVVFINKSKFNLYNSDGRTLVWQKLIKKFYFKNTRGTVKHREASVIVQGCISSYEVENLMTTLWIKIFT